MHTETPHRTLAPQQIQQTATLETISVTFYLWVFSCLLTASEVTAHVSGDNKLISYIPNNAPALSGSLLETTWQPLIVAIMKAEAPSGWLENILIASLAAPAPGAPPLTMAAFEHNLTSITTLAYALGSQTWSQNSTTSVEAGAGSLISMSVTQPKLVGQVHVNPIQVFFGIASIIVLASAVASMLSARWFGHTVLQRDLGTDMMRGGVLDFVTLLNMSSLPLLFAWKDPKTSRSKQSEGEIQRKRAEGLVVE